VFGDTFVDTFVAAAHEGELIDRRPSVERCLVEWASGRREQDTVGRGERLERLCQGLDHHHHPRATAERGVVDLSVDTFPVFAEVVEDDIERSIGTSFADEADVEW
jgi:hypothetical protein